MKNNKKMILTLALTWASVIPGLLLWNRLPDQLPIHFNFNGTPDEWAAKPMVLFLIPALYTVILVLIDLFMKKDEPGTKTAQNILLILFPITAWLVQAMTLYAGLGKTVNPDLFSRLVPTVIGLFLAVAGWQIRKLPYNRYVGFRVPWIMNDQARWQKNQLFSGTVLIIAGTAMIVAAWIVPGLVWLWIFVWSIILCLLYSIFAK